MRWCVALPSDCLEAVPYHDCLIENVSKCDFLAPECLEQRVDVVRCPSLEMPDGTDE
jgi:hypothetical protein